VAREPLDWLKYLEGQRLVQEKKLKEYSQYFEGDQPIRYMASALEKEFGARLTSLVINWPALAVEAYENRLDVEGFRLPGEGKTDEDLWRIWQVNGLDEESSQGHLEALINGRSFAIVGENEEDPKTPIITVEHPSQVVVYRDPRTRRILWGLKRWTDDEDPKRLVQHAALYGLNETYYYVMDSGEWVEDRDLRDEHNRNMNSVVQLPNRPRMLDPLGSSEFKNIIPIANAVNKMATDMMISAEFHAMPRRWVVGMSKDDWKDQDGNQVNNWDKVAGRIWAADRLPSEVQMGQFQEADLSNFHNSIKLLAQLVTQLLGLPPHYTGFTGDNPASADAIRSSEAQLVKRCERKQRVFGGAWEQVMRVARRIATGEDDPRMKQLETIWRDASTPTVAQKADAAQKLFTAQIVPWRQTVEDMGYTDAQIKLMQDERDKERQQNPLDQIARQFAEVNGDAATDSAGEAETAAGAVEQPAG
jgi:hypothetical protein